MPVIRIKLEDKERLDFMRGLIPATQFFTLLLDKYEQPTKKPVKEKKVHPLFNEMKGIYEHAWIANNNFAYRWNGVVDASALNRLIKSLEAINEGGKPIADLFAVIMDKLPNFYKDKTINAINKNLNGIIADIKNGGNKAGQIPHQGKYDFRN